MDTRSANSFAIRHGEAEIAFPRESNLCPTCMFGSSSHPILQASEQGPQATLGTRTSCTPCATRQGKYTSSSSRKAAKAPASSGCWRAMTILRSPSASTARPHRQSATFGYALRPCAGHPAQRSAYLMKLDGSQPGSELTLEARAAARQAIITNADVRARELAPVIADIRAGGVHSYPRHRHPAHRARHSDGPRRSGWAATQVRDIILRASK